LAKEQMTTMIWTTPLGLPVAQPYRKLRRRQVFTTLQSVYIQDPNAPTTIDARAQTTAFPPNFIHSLDATHMMLTALGCRNEQLTFASVHDSYWTHASSIDQMSRIIRDTFVVLHSTSILENMVEEIRQRYSGYKVAVGNFPGSISRTLGGVINIPERKLQSLQAAAECEFVMNASRLAADGAGTTEDDHAELLDDDEESDADVEEAEESAPKKTKKRATATRETKGYTKKMKTYFVNVTDLIPPVPAKGDFNIESIKKSLYFFS